MEWHDIFPTNTHVKLHIIVKIGLVLHHPATLFDSTNAVSKHEKGDQIMHGILPHIYEILPLSQPNDKQCITNDATQILLKFEPFTLTRDPIVIVLLKFI